MTIIVYDRSNEKLMFDSRLTWESFGNIIDDNGCKWNVTDEGNIVVSSGTYIAGDINRCVDIAVKRFFKNETPFLDFQDSNTSCVVVTFESDGHAKVLVSQKVGEKPFLDVWEETMPYAIGSGSDWFRAYFMAFSYDAFRAAMFAAKYALGCGGEVHIVDLRHLSGSTRKRAADRKLTKSDVWHSMVDSTSFKRFEDLYS